MIPTPPSKQPTSLPFEPETYPAYDIKQQSPLVVTGTGLNVQDYLITKILENDNIPSYSKERISEPSSA